MHFHYKFLKLLFWYNLMKMSMRKLALTLGLAIVFGLTAANAQQQQRNLQMKDTTHMKSKKPVHKKSSESYQMKKGGAAEKGKMDMNKGSMQKMEDTSKIKSEGKPVYKK